MINSGTRIIYNKDNLEVLSSLNDECIDLVYLDPPFNKKKTFTAPLKSSARGASFKDIWKEEDIKDEWVESINYENEELKNFLGGLKSYTTTYNYCYLVYMAVRLIECHRILKSTGSLYYHCDPLMSHYIKLTADCIFGEGNFRNELVWCYSSGGTGKRHFAKKHDVILFYSKTSDYRFNVDPIRERYKEKAKVEHKIVKGKKYLRKNPLGKVPLDWFEMPILTNTSKERTGYPTQKPVALLEKIIKVSTDKGDIVLDPFCGCATTCVASEKLSREWIGIDVSYMAYELVKERLKAYYMPLFKSLKGYADPEFSVDAPDKEYLEERKKKKAGYISFPIPIILPKTCTKWAYPKTPSKDWALTRPRIH